MQQQSLRRLAILCEGLRKTGVWKGFKMWQVRGGGGI